MKKVIPKLLALCILLGFSAALIYAAGSSTNYYRNSGATVASEVTGFDMNARPRVRIGFTLLSRDDLTEIFNISDADALPIGSTDYDAALSAYAAEHYVGCDGNSYWSGDYNTVDYRGNVIYAAPDSNFKKLISDIENGVSDLAQESGTAIIDAKTLMKYMPTIYNSIVSYAASHPDEADTYTIDLLKKWLQQENYGYTSTPVVMVAEVMLPVVGDGDVTTYTQGHVAVRDPNYSYWASASDMFVRCGGDYDALRSKAMTYTETRKKFDEYFTKTFSGAASSYATTAKNFEPVDKHIAYMCGYYTGITDGNKWPYKWTEVFFRTSYAGNHPQFVNTAGTLSTGTGAAVGHALSSSPGHAWFETSIAPNAIAGTSYAYASIPTGYVVGSVISDYEVAIPTKPTLGYSWDLGAHTDQTVMGAPGNVTAMNLSFKSNNQLAWVMYMQFHRGAVTADGTIVSSVGYDFTAGPWNILDEMHDGGQTYYKPKSSDPTGGSIYTSTGGLTYSHKQFLQAISGRWENGSGITSAPGPTILNGEDSMGNYAFCVTLNGNGFTCHPYNRTTHFVKASSKGNTGVAFSYTGTLMPGAAEIRANHTDAKDDATNHFASYSSGSDSEEFGNASNATFWTDKSYNSKIYEVMSGVPTTSDLYMVMGNQIWRITVQYVFVQDDYVHKISVQAPSVDNYSYYTLKGTGTKSSDVGEHETKLGTDVLDDNKWKEYGCSECGSSGSDAGPVNTKAAGDAWKKAETDRYKKSMQDAKKQAAAMIRASSIDSNWTKWCTNDTTHYNKVTNASKAKMTEADWDKIKEEWASEIESLSDTATSFSKSCTLMSTKTFEGMGNMKATASIKLSGSLPSYSIGSDINKEGYEHTHTHASNSGIPGLPPPPCTHTDYDCEAKYWVSSCTEYSTPTFTFSLTYSGDEGSSRGPYKKTDAASYTMYQNYQGVTYLAITECIPDVYSGAHVVDLLHNLGTVTQDGKVESNYVATKESGTITTDLVALSVKHLMFDYYVAGYNEDWFNNKLPLNQSGTANANPTSWLADTNQVVSIRQKPGFNITDYEHYTSNLGKKGRLINSFLKPSLTPENAQQQYKQKADAVKRALDYSGYQGTDTADEVKITYKFDSWGGRDVASNKAAQIAFNTACFYGQSNFIKVIDDFFDVGNDGIDQGTYACNAWTTYCGGKSWQSHVYAANEPNDQQNNSAQYILGYYYNSKAQPLHDNLAGDGWWLQPAKSSNPDNQLCPNDKTKSIRSTYSELYFTGTKNARTDTKFKTVTDFYKSKDFQASRTCDKLAKGKGNPYVAPFKMNPTNAQAANGQGWYGAAGYMNEGSNSFIGFRYYNNGRAPGYNDVQAGYKTNTKYKPIMQIPHTIRANSQALAWSAGTGYGNLDIETFVSNTHLMDNDSEIDMQDSKGRTIRVETGASGEALPGVVEFDKGDTSTIAWAPSVKHLNIETNDQNGVVETGSPSFYYCVCFFDRTGFLQLNTGNATNLSQKGKRIPESEGYGYNSDLRSGNFQNMYMGDPNLNYLSSYKPQSDVDVTIGGTDIAVGGSYNGPGTSGNPFRNCTDEMNLDVNDIVVYNPVSVQEASVPKQSQTVGDIKNKGTDGNAVQLGVNEYMSTPLRDQRILNTVNASRYSSTNSYYERTLSKVTSYGSLSMNAVETHYKYELKPDTNRTSAYDTYNDYTLTTVSPNAVQTVTEDTEFTFTGDTDATLRVNLYNNAGYSTFIALAARPGETFKYVHDRMSIYRKAPDKKTTINELLNENDAVHTEGINWNISEDNQRYLGTVSSNSASIVFDKPIQLKAGDVFSTTLYFEEKTYSGQDYDVSFGDATCIREDQSTALVKTSDDGKQTGKTHFFEALADCAITPTITIKQNCNIFMYPADAFTSFEDTFLACTANDGSGFNTGGPLPVTSYTTDIAGLGNCYNFLICETYTDAAVHSDKIHCMDFQFHSNMVSFTPTNEALHNPHKVPSYDVRPYLVGKLTRKGVVIESPKDPLINTNTSTASFYVEKSNDELYLCENFAPNQRTYAEMYTQYYPSILDDGSQPTTNILSIRTLIQGTPTSSQTNNRTIMFKVGGQWYVSTLGLARIAHSGIGLIPEENKDIEPDLMWTRIDQYNENYTTDNPLTGETLPLNVEVGGGVKLAPYNEPGYFYECYYGSFSESDMHTPLYTLNVTEEDVEKYPMPYFNQALVYTITDENADKDWVRKKYTKPTDLALSRVGGKITISLDDDFQAKIPSNKITFTLLKDETSQLAKYSMNYLYHAYKNNMNTDRWVKEKYIVFPFDVYTSKNPSEPIDLSNPSNLVFHKAFERIHLGVFTQKSVVGETDPSSPYFGMPKPSDSETVLANISAYTPLAPWTSVDAINMKTLDLSKGYDTAGTTTTAINIYDNNCHFFDFGYKDKDGDGYPDYTYYFYTPLEVGEAAMSNINVHVIGINSITSGASNIQRTNESSPGRPNTFENAGTSFITDIVGRIGALTILNNDDARFSDTFKQGTSGADNDDWLIYGLVKRINSYSNVLAGHGDTPSNKGAEGSQETIITDPFDVRGRGTDNIATGLTNRTGTSKDTAGNELMGKTALDTVFRNYGELSKKGPYVEVPDLNTYSTQDYKASGNLTKDTTGNIIYNLAGVNQSNGSTYPNGSTIGYSLPLQAVHNIHNGLKNVYPRIGYTTYMTLETIGGYYGENKRSSDIDDTQLDKEPSNSNNDYGQEKIQIEPIYYDLMIPDVGNNTNIPDVTNQMIVTAVDVYMLGMNGNYRRINANQSYYDSIGMSNVPMEVFYNNEYYIYDSGEHPSSTLSDTSPALDQATLKKGVTNREAEVTIKTTKNYSAIMENILGNYLSSTKTTNYSLAQGLSPRVIVSTVTGSDHYAGTLPQVKERIDMDSILTDFSQSNYYPDKYVLGNAQYIFLRERNRTYIGGPTNALSGTQPDSDYATTLQNSQKWYFGIGLPSSAQFVPSGISNPTEADFIQPTTEIDGVKYKHYILTCVDIIAKGSTWTLEYDSSVANVPIVLHDINDKLTQFTLANIKQINTTAGAVSKIEDITNINDADVTKGTSNISKHITDIHNKIKSGETSKLVEVKTTDTGKTITPVDSNQFSNLAPFVLDTSVLNPTGPNPWVKEDVSDVLPGQDGSSHSGDTTNINTIAPITDLYPVDDEHPNNITGITSKDHPEYKIPHDITNTNPLVPTKVNGTTINIKEVTPSELGHLTPGLPTDVTSVTPSNVTPSTPNVFTVEHLIPVICNVPGDSSTRDLTSYGTH